MPVCAVLIAGLCFNALEARCAVDLGALAGSSVRATTARYTATLYFGSDDITAADWS